LNLAQVRPVTVPPPVAQGRLVKETLRMRPSRIMGLVIAGSETSAVGHGARIPGARGRRVVRAPYWS